MVSTESELTLSVVSGYLLFHILRNDHFLRVALQLQAIESLFLIVRTWSIFGQ